jgi:hypothetical protein
LVIELGLHLRRDEQRERGDEQLIDSEERCSCFHGVCDELAAVSFQLAGKKVGRVRKSEFGDESLRRVCFLKDTQQDLCRIGGEFRAHLGAAGQKEFFEATEQRAVVGGSTIRGGWRAEIGHDTRSSRRRAPRIQALYG